MRFLVTGAGGFVGSHLSRRLLQEGHTILAVGRRPVTPLSRDLVASDRFRSEAADICDAAGFTRILRGHGKIDGIFHLAAQLPGDNGSLPGLIGTNVLGTATVVQGAHELGVPRVVLSSSMSVYSPRAPLPITEESMTEPTTAYGLSKLHAEAVARHAATEWGLHIVCLRYSGIFGLGNGYGSVHLYVSRALQGQPVAVFARGAIVKDFVSVADVVDANLLAMARSATFTFEVFNIGGGAPTSLADIAQTVVEQVGAGTVMLTDTPAADGVRDFAYDISKARALLAYAPAALATRVREYAEDLRGTGCSPSPGHAHRP